MLNEELGSAERSLVIVGWHCLRQRQRLEQAAKNRQLNKKKRRLWSIKFTDPKNAMPIGQFPWIRPWSSRSCPWWRPPIAELCYRAPQHRLSCLRGLIRLESLCRFAPVSSCPNQHSVMTIPGCCDDQTRALERCAKPPPVERSSPATTTDVESFSPSTFGIHHSALRLSLFPKLQPTVRTMAHSTWKTSVLNASAHIYKSYTYTYD